VGESEFHLEKREKKIVQRKEKQLARRKRTFLTGGGLLNVRGMQGGTDWTNAGREGE